VTWEHAGSHATPSQKIAAIYNPRWSAERVRQLVELIYVESAYSLYEQIEYANNRSFNPYPAKFGELTGIPWMGQIICGHNPWLFARLVDGLRVEDLSGDEQAFWNERLKP
jgi:hypothetical protein